MLNYQREIFNHSLLTNKITNLIFFRVLLGTQIFVNRNILHIHLYIHIIYTPILVPMYQYIYVSL